MFINNRTYAISFFLFFSHRSFYSCLSLMKNLSPHRLLLSSASTQVVLTVQQKPATGLQGVLQTQRPVSLTGGAVGTGMVSSPPPSTTSLHRASTAPAGGAPCTARITGPQPVDVSPTSTIHAGSRHQHPLLHPMSTATSALLSSTTSSVLEPLSYFTLTRRSPPNASSSPKRPPNVRLILPLYHFSFFSSLFFPFS